ncbi:hydrocephalus-inducing protein-like [Polypterus senegalus]|uniref:hydrocephalus-inducing protein-like n=1 Tax=Polypterus senegalus TaxID=55291 RepID=UPI0019659840|nr:hydrocephalus-inducing protein-like [Polypterus senegalus]
MPDKISRTKVVAPRHPKLVHCDQKKLKLTPSAFMKDMNLTTEQKLASTHEMCPPQIIEMMDMSENSYSKLSTVDVDQAIFQPFPSEICFQNYTPCETYEFPLILRNIDKVPRLVKIVEDDSPYFRVISPPDVHNKVAPGMSSTFHILFKPDENKDYSHLLVFMTEREKFVVPIKAIGARAILDFPDHLNFSDCPVKYLSQKTLLVRNIGNREARFTLNTCSPFSVSPKMSNLGIGESMQVAVDFFPEVNGDHSGELVLHYDTGEDIYISLYGAASDLNVRLSKNTVIIEKTYLSMISQRSVTISNRSDVIVHYQWMAFATPQDEEQLKCRSSLDLQQQEEIEMELFLEECNADPSIREKISILHRSFQHRLRMLQDEKIAFVDDVFSLQPAEGEIWPNSTVEVNIFFKPKEEKVYQQNIYCDITGRESRLLLRIKGEGIGPKLTFSFDEVDVGHMFIGSKHTYEVLLTNKGFISAVFCLVPPDSAVGACFSFNPSKGIIHPGGFQAIQVELCSKILGVFKEDFYFSVDGSSQNIYVTFRGCIVGPTFHFNVPSLNFGDVSFGFPQKLSCQLNNTALIPISFNLRISGDGSGDESVTSFTQVSDLSRTHWKSNKKIMQPREFTVSPSRGVIRAISEMDIEITLCSNTVKQYEVALVVDVDGVGEEILALPIFARCVVPPVRLMSPFLEFKKCFINFSYHNNIKVVNEGCLPACCGLITQENDESSKVEYTSPNPRAVVNPCCVLEIPLVLQVKAVGKHSIMAYVAVFGSRERFAVHISCIGKGPVVHVSTMEVDFGYVPVLTNISRTLKLSNQSPIPAFYVAEMDNVKSLWQLEPCEGIIPSEGETEINLVANLDDTVWFQDKIHLTIESSQSHIIPVSAKGMGTTIVADRPLAPAIHLGTYFSSGICQYPFKLTNMGRRCHELFWMTEGFSPFRRQIPTFHRSAKGLSRLNSKNLKDSPNPVFKLYPMTAELFPGQSIDVVLKGTSNVPKEVKERLICKAVLGKQTKKERIMTVDVSCQFIAPVLEVSEKHLSFFVEKQPGKELEAQLRPLVLKNVSVLELSMILTVTEPYSICCTEEDNVVLSLSKTVTLEVDQELHLLIQFDPTFFKDKYSWETDESLTIMYADHPQKDYVSIHGEVHFPNLHFSSLEVDFGCILNGTESSKSIEMTNCSPLPVRFCWSVLQDDIKKERLTESPEVTVIDSEDLLSEVGKVSSSGETKEGRISSKDLPHHLHTFNLLKEKVLYGSENRLCFSTSQDFLRVPFNSQEEYSEDTEKQVFDVFPVYGSLDPNEVQIVTFTFYGYSDTKKQVCILCEVDEGPTYELTLKGEASIVQYTIDRKEIDYGLQEFDCVAHAEITLKNTGKVNFEFNVLNGQQCAFPENLQPGIPLVLPQSGYIEAYAEQRLSVHYFPGIPETFQKSFDIQVSYFKPDTVLVKGEGIFPRIFLDLPRNLMDDERYSSLVKKARKAFHMKKDNCSEIEEQSLDEYILSTDCLIQMEVERLLIKEHALEQERHYSSHNKDVSDTGPKWRRRLVRCKLPEYYLDFGYVTYGNVCKQKIKVINTGILPASFQIDKQILASTGLSTELYRVKSLPFCETETFELRFDPASVALHLGDIDILVPIQVFSGPIVQIHVHAIVIIPSLTLSTAILEFDSILCGQCQVKNFQIYNHVQVVCEWVLTEEEKPKLIDKHMPLHLRRKAKIKTKPSQQVFELLPSSGILLPGERVNVQVKFSPTKEKLYTESIFLRISQSKERKKLIVQGKGLELHLDFCPSVLEFVPILPYSNGDKIVVTVKNPCAYPIEFYSLEFDKQYHEEEKILRMLKGYDSDNILLLPPRNPGEKLPPEILEYYEDWKKGLEEQGIQEEESKIEEQEECVTSETENREEVYSALSFQESVISLPVCQLTDEAEEESRLSEITKVQMSELSSSSRVGEIDAAPVAKAIARHLGIDVSPEANAAKNRRGIAIIVHGAPVSGKTNTALTLAKHYGTPCLNIDSIILEALESGSTATGLQARELCVKAAVELAQKKAEEAVVDLSLSHTQSPGVLSGEAVTKHFSEVNQVPEVKSSPHSAASVRNKPGSAGAKGRAESAAFQKQHSSEHPASVQLNDCSRGVVFDSLETLYCRSLAHALCVVLKAINNRQYIFMIDLKHDYVSLKAREKAKKDAEEQFLINIITAEKIWIAEMDEDEYDALTEEERSRIDHKRLENLRKRREQEKLVKELKVKKLPEKAEKQKIDAKLKKKGKKGKKDDIASGKKPLTTVKMVSTVSARSEAKGEHPGGEKKYSVPDSVVADHREGEDGGKKRRGKESKTELHDITTSGTESTEDSEKGQLSDSEKQLIQRFKLYEQNQKNIAEILECWDRSQGITVCLAVQDDNVQEVEETATVEQRPSTAGKKGGSTVIDGEGGDAIVKDNVCEGKIDLGVPYLELHVTGQCDPSGEKILERKWLPHLHEVLDGMGLGPSGPPLPPPFILSVVRYPVKRTSLGNQNALEHFAFLAPSTEEIIEEKKLIESETETLASSLKGKPKKEKSDAGKDTQKDKDKRRSPSNKKTARRTESCSPILDAQPVEEPEPVPQSTEIAPEKVNKLTTFRWIIPAYGEVSLIIHFTSDVLGCFEQMLNFEIMGMSKLYQLSCKGICAFPAVCKDPTMVFANHKKKPMPNEIIHKKFITATDVYQFGPLLCGKNRERFKEGRYPENMEKILAHNSSALNVDIHFSFLHDTKATTFLMDPPMLSLKPNESQMLTIWAYPTSPGLFEDAVVFCIKENPEPLLFKISCLGIRPELELDRKQLHFDKILLHRRETKTLYLRNHTLLPVAWKLIGLENLGDEFSVSQDHGVILPKSEYALQMYFRAQKQINLKKVIRLEVSDAEYILGIVYTENIQIFAEAYDVTLDVSFPKDGGLDFGVIKVMEEAKQVISLKNKGKYEIAFCFLLDATEPEMPELKSLFTIQPLKGTLNPNEKALQVHITFQSTKEVCIKNKAVLHCQVIEPNVCIGGETIFSIPVKLSIQSVFSKYICVPTNELNFGAIMYGSRRTRTFSIENKGELEIRFMLSMMSGEPTLQPLRRSTPMSKRGRSHEGSVSGRSVSLKARRSDSVLQKEMGSALARLTVGEFTISPGYGIIPIGAQQAITVDCVVEQVGKRQETLSIDISDRDPEDHPAGIPYHLVVEGCVPGITVNDIPSIFEEHRICKNVNLYQCLQTIAFGGIFVEDENRFIFVNTLVGQQAKAQFKIINAGKIPCDVSLSVKPITSKPGFKIAEIFELEPSRMIILSHSHSFAVVTFSPQSMQCYQCIFEASMEGNFSNIPRPKSLVFDIIGEGNLPQITVVRPAMRTRIGNPLILFSRLLLGHTEKHQLVLKNDGTIPAEINIDLVDENQAFIVNPGPDTQCVHISPYNKKEDILVSENNTHAASLILSPGLSAEFGIFFTPSTVQRYCGSVHIMVVDNQYEDCVVQLVGEGYQDEITLDNICRPKGSVKMETTEAPVDQDTVEANRSDHIYYGDCHVGKPYQETFTMTNRSNADSMRFEWLSDIPQLKFFPQIGHVHAGCTKNVTITFHSDQPITLSAQIVKCKVTKIVFQQPVDQVPDWDTRMRTVKWLDAARESEIQRTTKKKVIETDSEPAHTAVENTTRELELRVSAACDYAQFTCKSEAIHFKDTLLFQTRVFELSISNTGCVQLEYSWQTTMEANGRTIILNDRHTDSAEGASFTGSRTGSRSVSHPTSTLESVSTMMSAESELPPFSIEPIAGVIDPEEQQVFVIKFSPLELGEFEGEISCSIPNLKNTQGPAMTVKGRSLLPNCHFDLEDSDYIRSNRRNPDMKGPRGAPPRASLDANTRVIEFFSVGIKKTVSRTFNIMNPTSAPYTFQWRCDDQEDLKVQPAFRCLTEKGTVNSQKKTEITFEFLPQNLEITESFWSFVIHEQNITLPFLLVGKAREPVVSLDRSHLNYKSLAVGLQAQETVYLVNNEDTSFFFSFQEDSLHSEGFVYSLIVHPMEGSIHPQSSLPVIISFKPTNEGKVNFNLQCNIKRKTQPLTLHVKAEVYYMNVSVQYENSEGILTDLSLDMENNICFGQVGYNEESAFHFLISNTGTYNLDFIWEICGPDDVLQFLKINPLKDKVLPGVQIQSTLTFCPKQFCVIKNAGLCLKILNGPTFNCVLEGSAVTPGIHFSFTKHDFGLNFIYYAGMVPSTQKLCITNKGDKEARIECLFTSTSYLEVACQTEVLQPSGVLEVPITFHPREPIKYHEKVIFQINKFTQQIVEILGHGAEMKIEVEDPNHKSINLGALQVGETVTKVIPVVNKSRISLSFFLCLTQQMLLDSKVLWVSPSGDITLNPSGGRCMVEVVFSPTCRIPPFIEEVMMDSTGIRRSLFVVRGSCQGMEIILDQDYIPFGAVAQRSQATRRLLMQNTGDIGARFKWDKDSFLPDFSIYPDQGYITPGMEVPFEVTFSPKELNQEIRYENLFCSIEGGKTCKLTLTGSCVSATIKEVINFSCQVRGRQTQTVVLPNKTVQPWVLHPIIEGEYWSGPQSFTIEAQQSKPYEITYRPLTMTTEGKKHQGSVFFPFPDGTGQLHMLQGTADPPKPVSTISREVPCKTSYSEMLSVSNWLAKPQRFRVCIEIMKPEKIDITTELKGLDYVDVPASAKRDYKLTFFSYKEGAVQAKVIFQNETNQEYLYYILNFKATPPSAISSIEMVTVVRQSTSATVKVENPLPFPTTFLVDCKQSDVTFPAQLNIPAESEGALMFEYQPLKAGDFIGRLTLLNSDLGAFHYDLILKALPASPEKPLYFRAMLGSSQLQVARFINYCKPKVEFICKSDSPDFSVEKSFSVQPGTPVGTEVGVDVCFEPCHLGESQGLLTIHSSVGGNYIFPLFGTSLTPKAQGPIIVRAGSNTSIPFKNVFLQNTTFSFQVDNPFFSVKPSETIPSKKTKNISVFFGSNPTGSKAPVPGKMTVSCPRSEGSGQTITWVYYLKGHTP